MYKAIGVEASGDYTTYFLDSLINCMRILHCMRAKMIQCLYFKIGGDDAILQLLHDISWNKLFEALGGCRQVFCHYFWVSISIGGVFHSDNHIFQRSRLKPINQ